MSDDEAWVARILSSQKGLIALARLGLHALSAYREGYRMSPGEIQYHAEALKLVEPVLMHERCGEICRCVDDFNATPTWYCYRDTEATTLARRVLEEES